MSQVAEVEDFNALGEIQKIDEGEYYVLLQNLYCYQILTKDGHQVFGTYDPTTAKNKFKQLEIQAREM